MRPIVREAIIPLLIAGSIGLSYVGTTYLPRLDPRPHISNVVERVSEYWVERRSAHAERREARAQTTRTPTLTPQAEPRPETEPPSPSSEPYRPTPSPQPETPRETQTTREAQHPVQQPTVPEHASESGVHEPARTIEIIIEESEVRLERAPESELEGIIGAWQAATVSRMTVVEPLVNQIARDFDVTPATIYGIILSESSLYPDALSTDGKYGLLQHEPHVFEAIVELSSHTGTPVSDPLLADRIWDPEMNLRAYRVELRAHREYLGMHDVIDIHVVRGASETVSDYRSYLRTPEALEHRERIERRIAEAERLLSFSHPSDEYHDMTSQGWVGARLVEQYDTMLSLAERTSGQYRAAYLTNAVSYARILDLRGPVRAALERASHDPSISSTIENLTIKLDTPLGVDHRP
ncbi:MAG: transglycosylase SLT domain-containing protein [Candidatus Woesearchaeota archaeon]